MLKNLLDVLLGSEEDKLDDDDEKIALAALCVRVANQIIFTTKAKFLVLIMN